MRLARAPLALLSIAMLTGCAERRNPADVSIQAHPAAWNDPTSPDFHGARVAQTGFGLCGRCHDVGAKQSSAVPSCFDCHDGPGGHPAGWQAQDSAAFHGEFVAVNTFERCKSCHGADVRGGWSGVSCYGTCHNGPGGHPMGWLDENGPNFHWDYIRQVGSNDSCRRCHGPGLGGGWSGIDCESCHI